MLPSFFGLRHMACLLAASAMMPAGAQTQQDQPANNYPTTARVEYVGECMAKNGGAQAYLYKCACVIDQIAARLPYDDYVESSTFARYATLGGEGGAIFRDPEYGKNAARRYRGIQEEALHACGIAPATRAAR